MKEKCCECGKSEITDSGGKCFECAGVSGTKYVDKKKILSPELSKVIWIISGVLDIWFTFLFFQQTEFKMLPTIAYVLIQGYMVIFVVIGDGTGKLYYGRESQNILFLLLKAILLMDIPASVAQHGFVIGGMLGKIIEPLLRSATTPSLLGVLIIYIVRPVIVYAVLLTVWECVGRIARKFKKDRKDWQYLILNDILDKEERVQKLETISEYIPIYSETSKKEDELDWLIEARSYVRNSDVSEEVKEKLISMLESEENEVWATNDVMLEYHKIIEECMLREIKQDENGNWVDEMGEDMKNSHFPIQFPSSITIAKKYHYVTRKLFEIEARVSREVNNQWSSFGVSHNILNPTGWFGSFKKELIGLSLGDIGEKRVAQELAPYNDQMIILPNIRLEVEGESIESDFVVISPWGVHILEVKNLGSSGAFDLVIEKDGRWSQVRGYHKETMDSPVHQNERHIVYMEKLVNRELGRGIDDRIMIQGMVVLANNKVDIKNFSDNVIKRYDNIIGTIRSGEKVLKETDMKQIAEILKKYALPVKEYSAPNYFKLFFETKILVEEYKHWKSKTKELVQVAEVYKGSILEPLQKNN